MKWALTSPDGIGDFLLRLPWLFEMERRGWELLLVAREPTLEAARMSGLKATFVPIQLSPYSKAAKQLRDPFAGEFRAVTAFDPGIVFLGPLHFSMLEEEAFEKLAGYRLGGFVSEDDFWPSEGVGDPRKLAETLALRVPVCREDSEPVRNARAAGSLLGEQVTLAPFRFAGADETEVPSGLKAREFLVVSPGYRDGDYFQGWGEENWIRELRGLETRTGLPFVFTGSSGERTSNAAIVSQLNFPQRHRDLTGQIPSIAELVRLLRGSAAYVGKDSGTMHLAAAAGTPVVAVFGGGHWKRFLPTGTRAVVLTVEVPCRGCDWRCHLPEPVCVRDLAEGCLLEAWERLQALPAGETVILDQPASEKARGVLRAHPQDGYPAKQHALRKLHLQQVREDSRLPIFVRFWRRLRADYGRRAK